MKPLQRVLQTAAILPYLAIGILPVVLLSIRALQDGLAISLTAGASLDFQREFILFLKTSLYAVSVTATVTAVGILAAVYLCGTGKRIYHQFTWILFMTLPVPACVHAQAWLKWIGVLNNTGLFNLNARGWVISWLVQSLALLPVGILVIAGGILMINKDQIMAAQLLAPDLKYLARLLPRYLQPQILATAAIVFILTINDYAIPSIFSVNVYAIGIFVEYSSSLSLYRTLLKSLPLMFVEILLLVAILKVVSRAFLSGKSGEFSTVDLAIPKPVDWISRLAPALVTVQFAGLASAILLDRKMWLSLGSTLVSSANDLVTSLLIAALAGVAGLPVIYITAVWLNNTRFQKTGLFIILLPAVLPAALMGVAYINLFNHPQTQLVYTSILMPALAVLARFMPFGVLITLAWIKRLDVSLLNAAEILESRSLRNTLKIRLPLLATGLLAGMALVFLLSVGELGATVLVLPAGLSTVTVRLYNYLHYGATEMVQGLAGILLAIIGLLAAAGKLLLRRKKL